MVEASAQYCDPNIQDTTNFSKSSSLHWAWREPETRVWRANNPGLWARTNLFSLWGADINPPVLPPTLSQTRKQQGGGGAGTLRENHWSHISLIPDSVLSVGIWLLLQSGIALGLPILRTAYLIHEGSPRKVRHRFHLKGEGSDFHARFIIFFCLLEEKNHRDTFSHRKSQHGKFHSEQLEKPWRNRYLDPACTEPFICRPHGSFMWCRSD